MNETMRRAREGGFHSLKIGFDALVIFHSLKRIWNKFRADEFFFSITSRFFCCCFVLNHRHLHVDET